MEGYRFFRKARQGKRGGGDHLYVKEQLECLEFCLGMDEELTKSVCGSGLQVTLWWESATGHLTRKTRQMKPSIDR